MKRKLVSILLSVMIAISMINVQPAWADASGEFTKQAEAFLTHLETEFLPKVGEVLNPEQLEQFKSLIENEFNLKQAFKSVSLTPEQKTKLDSLVQAIPKKEFFTSMTPDQKRELFMKKKEMYSPDLSKIKSLTPDEKREYFLKQKEKYVPSMVKLGESGKD